MLTLGQWVVVATLVAEHGGHANPPLLAAVDTELAAAREQTPPTTTEKEE